MTCLQPGLHGLARAVFPARDLELATHLSRWHDSTTHHLSASECETLALPGLLALASPAHRARWDNLTLGYTDPLGAAWLRTAIAAGYTAITEAGLVCFAGAQEALYATLHALLTPEDHAIVILPSYQSIETLTLGLCPVSGIALDVNDGWSLDIGAVVAAIRPNTRLLAISFPNNPTGKQLDPARFAALIALCRHHGLWLLSDEVYRLTERDPAARLPHAADAYERGISLGAVSKGHGLPGLRIGWVACQDPTIAARLATLRQYLSTCSAGPSEILAAIALDATPTILARNRAIIEANLALLLPFLARHAGLFDCHPPEAGMSCYPRYKGQDGVERFTTRLAETAGILLLPARVFHSDLCSLPENHFRIGFGRRTFPAALAALETALA